MDGNGRWAEKRSKPRHAGHRAGVSAARETVRASAKAGVDVLTLFAFSSENWKRPKKEVDLLMSLFIDALDREINELHKNKVRVRFIGQLAKLSARLRRKISDAEALTGTNTGMTLVIAVAYGGRWDIAHAVRQVLADVDANKLAADAIDPEMLGGYLQLAGLPDPDLFIRTGGERRISNFLLWNLAYTELFFTDQLWPDFGENELLDAFKYFAARQRRFGRTRQQLEVG